MFALYLLLQFLSKFLKGWFFIIPGSKSCKWVKKNPEKSGIRGENLVFLRQNIYYITSSAFAVRCRIARLSATCQLSAEVPSLKSRKNKFLKKSRNPDELGKKFQKIPNYTNFKNSRFCYFLIII